MRPPPISPENPSSFHDYTVYGLHLRSCIALPELTPVPVLEVEPDLWIRCGPVPDRLEAVRTKTPFWQAAPDRVLIMLEGIARYLISDGREIVIETEPAATDQEVRLFLLGSALGAALQQRGRLTLHASVVIADGRAVAFLGQSGRGKSSLAAALAQRGFPVLADDICALEMRPEGPLVPAGPPHFRLWEDARQRLGLERGARHRLHPEEPKYLVPMAAARSREATPLGRCYQLDPETESGVEASFTALRGREKLNTVLANTYRRAFFEGMGLGASYFQACSQLAQDIPIYQLRFERDLGGLGRLAGRVAEHLLVES